MYEDNEQLTQTGPLDARDAPNFCHDLFSFLQFYQLIARPNSFPASLQEKSGSNAFWVNWIDGEPALVLLGAEAEKYVLTHSSDFIFGEGGGYHIIAREMFPQGVLTSDGEIHDQLRHAVLERLTPRKFQQEDCNFLLQCMAEAFTSLSGRVNILKLAQDITFKYAIYLALSTEGEDKLLVAKLKKLWHSFSLAAFDIFRQPNNPLLPYRYAMQSREKLVEILKGIIDKRREMPPQDDILGQLMQVQYPFEQNRKLTDEEIINNLLMVIYAAHDTTTNTLTFLFKELERHPDAYHHLEREIEDKYHPGEPCTPDSLANLPTLAACIHETLRLHPQVSPLPRKTIHEMIIPVDTKDGSIQLYRVAEKTLVFLMPGRTQRMQEYYPDPDSFHFERYQQRLTTHPHGKRYEPPFSAFGGGSRSCVGEKVAMLEMMLFVVEFLRRKRIISFWQNPYIPTMNGPLIHPFSQSIAIQDRRS